MFLFQAALIQLYLFQALFLLFLFQSLILQISFHHLYLLFKIKLVLNKIKSVLKIIPLALYQKLPYPNQDVFNFLGFLPHQNLELVFIHLWVKEHHPNLYYTMLFLHTELFHYLIVLIIKMQQTLILQTLISLVQVFQNFLKDSGLKVHNQLL